MLTLSDVLLNEVKISITKRGLSSKRNALAGATAMSIAKKRNPALYRLYMKHNLIRKQIKSRIQKQYAGLAKAAARRKIR